MTLNSGTKNYPNNQRGDLCFVLDKWKELTIKLPTTIRALHDSVDGNNGWGTANTCLDPAQPATLVPPVIDEDMFLLPRA